MLPFKVVLQKLECFLSWLPSYEALNQEQWQSHFFSMPDMSCVFHSFFPHWGRHQLSNHLFLQLVSFTSARCCCKSLLDSGMNTGWVSRKLTVKTPWCAGWKVKEGSCTKKVSRALLAFRFQKDEMCKDSSYCLTVKESAGQLSIESFNATSLLPHMAVLSEAVQ